MEVEQLSPNSPFHVRRSNKRARSGERDEYVTARRMKRRESWMSSEAASFDSPSTESKTALNAKSEPLLTPAEDWVVQTGDLTIDVLDCLLAGKFEQDGAALSVEPLEPMDCDLDDHMDAEQPPLIINAASTMDRSHNPGPHALSSINIGTNSVQLIGDHTQISKSTMPAASRKQRLTMGPRADCEKCQQGVPGHWMHFR